MRKRGIIPKQDIEKEIQEALRLKALEDNPITETKSNKESKSTEAESDLVIEIDKKSTKEKLFKESKLPENSEPKQEPKIIKVIPKQIEPTGYEQGEENKSKSQKMKDPLLYNESKKKIQEPQETVEVLESFQSETKSTGSATATTFKRDNKFKNNNSSNALKSSFTKSYPKSDTAQSHSAPSHSIEQKQPSQTTIPTFIPKTDTIKNPNDIMQTIQETQAKKSEVKDDKKNIEQKEAVNRNDIALISDHKQKLETPLAAKNQKSIEIDPRSLDELLAQAQKAGEMSANRRTNFPPRKPRQQSSSNEPVPNQKPAALFGTLGIPSQPETKHHVEKSQDNRQKSDSRSPKNYVTKHLEKTTESTADFLSSGETTEVPSPNIKQQQKSKSNITPIASDIDYKADNEDKKIDNTTESLIESLIDSTVVKKLDGKAMGLTQTPPVSVEPAVTGSSEKYTNTDPKSDKVEGKIESATLQVPTIAIAEPVNDFIDPAGDTSLEKENQAGNPANIPDIIPENEPSKDNYEPARAKPNSSKEVPLIEDDHNKSKGEQELDANTLESKKEPSHKAFLLKDLTKKNSKPINVTITVSVTSLGKKMGCSHFSRSIVTYVEKHLKKKACIVSFSGQLEMDGYDVYPKEEIPNLYDKYDLIVLDLGKYNPKYDKEIMRSPIRIMCSFYEDKYIKELASFIKMIEHPTKWHYFFNHVPKSKKKLVAELMEDYNYWCAPVYDDTDLEKDIIKEFSHVLGGK